MFLHDKWQSTRIDCWLTKLVRLVLSLNEIIWLMLSLRQGGGGGSRVRIFSLSLSHIKLPLLYSYDFSKLACFHVRRDMNMKSHSIRINNPPPHYILPKGKPWIAVMPRYELTKSGHISQTLAKCMGNGEIHLFWGSEKLLLTNRTHLHVIHISLFLQETGI